MMTRMFKSQLGKNIEIYIDDMVVKSKVVSEHLGDLRTIFEILRKYKLCLNASKHGCQNRDLDRKIARFYDLTSLKRLESH